MRNIQNAIWKKKSSFCLPFISGTVSLRVASKSDLNINNTRFQFLCDKPSGEMVGIIIAELLSADLISGLASRVFGIESIARDFSGYFLSLLHHS